MFWLLFILLAGSKPDYDAELKPIREIKLDNKRMYLSRVHYSDVRLERDGSYTAVSQYHLWHWDENGALINRIGGKGEGPGEFERLGLVYWTGAYYWTIDARRLSSTVFDKAGRFVSKQDIYYRQFVEVDDQLFMVDTSRFDPHNPGFPRVLQEIQYQIEDGGLTVQKTDLLFRKVSLRQMELDYNFKLLWAVREGERYLVVDQLEPKIRIYDPESRAREREVPLDQTYEPPFIPIQARFWVDPPERFPKVHRDQAFQKWWHSWSRINYFGKAGNGYVVAYEIPNEADPLDSLQGIQRIDREGRAVGDLMVLRGYCLGARGDELFVFVENDVEDRFEYFIQVYPF